MRSARWPSSRLVLTHRTLARLHNTRSPTRRAFHRADSLDTAADGLRLSEIFQLPARKDSHCFFEYVALLPHSFQFPLELAHLLFLCRLMPTAWERFVTVVGQFLAPLRDGGVGNAQLTG